MKLRSVAILLLMVNVAWSLVSVYSVWSQSQTNANGGMNVTAIRLPYKPDSYYVVTNSSPMDSFIINAVMHPGTPFTWFGPQDEFDQLLREHDYKVEYQAEYYAVGASFWEGEPSTRGTLVWPPPVGLTLAGFAVLGVLWTSAGAVRWNKRAKQQHSKSN